MLTLGVPFAESAPPTPASYCEMELLPALATYTLIPSGLTAIPIGDEPDEAFLANDSSPPGAMLNCVTTEAALVAYTPLAAADAAPGRVTSATHPTAIVRVSRMRPDELSGP